MHEVEIAVVGAGPAGLSAAIEAARAGAKVLLLDENRKPGGQLFKQIHKFFGSKAHYAAVRGIDIGCRLLDEAQESGVETWLNIPVWGLFGNHTLAVIRDGRAQTVRAKKIILATGASENALSFPGWTLPGVMTAGAAQTMMNIHRVLPGQRVLMVGAGNIGLIVSYQLLQAGGEVVAVIEAMDQIGGYAVHAAKIRRAGVPILVSHTIREAHGREQVEAATIVQVDEQMQPIPGTERRLGVDTVCLAVGLTPLAELGWMAGCGFAYIPDLGGFVPLHDENMETTLPGLYVAGDITGIEEANSAMEEGRLAGLAAAEALGYLREEAISRKAEVRQRLDSLRLGPFGEKRQRAKERLLGECRGQLAKQEPPDVSKSCQDLTRSRITVVTGVLSLEELAGSPGYPSQERLRSGKVAVIECMQQIPCDPCVGACPRGAISIAPTITDLPVLDAEKCNGCGLCLPACPGLAIFLVDLTFSPTETLVAFPYEYLPLPKVGTEVEAVDREGHVVARGRVVRVQNPPRYDRTPVISIAIPKEFAQVVRSIKRSGKR